MDGWMNFEFNQPFNDGNKKKEKNQSFIHSFIDYLLRLLLLLPELVIPVDQLHDMFTTVIHVEDRREGVEAGGMEHVAVPHRQFRET